MKILLVHNHYQQAGGEHVAVEAQSILLREHGHHVILYTRDSAEINGYNMLRKVSFFPNALYSLQTYREIRNLIKNEQPDVAHVHNVFPLISPTVYRVLKDAGIPIVQTIHNFRFMCPNGLFYTHGQICERCKYGNMLHAVRWKCYRESRVLSALYAFSIALHRRWDTFDMIDQFITLTEFTAQKLLTSGFTTKNKISVLGNFLQNPLPVVGSFENREPYILYLGRLSTEKGIEILLEAMDGLSNLRLKIAGSGPLINMLQSTVQQQNLHQVEFLGHVTGEKKWSLLRQAMATIVPSVCYEQLPFTVLESLAVGTPVIASNLGGLPFVIENNKNGLLFNLEDQNDLQAKLTFLVTHPTEVLEMGRNARKFIEQNFSVLMHYKKLMDIYDLVIKRS